MQYLVTATGVGFGTSDFKELGLIVLGDRAGNNAKCAAMDFVRKKYFHNILVKTVCL